MDLKDGGIGGCLAEQPLGLEKATIETFVGTSANAGGLAERDEEALARFPDRIVQMHPFFEKADHLSRELIGAASEVHQLKEPGLIESIYEFSF
ncbi:MAG TPA: hypothetical protein P5186_26050 [Candidatus Paceibacterota bacterium]|nr:hypothetical protein [Candidatus Paceibacterota bacterium]